MGRRIMGAINIAPNNLPKENDGSENGGKGKKYMPINC